jgi:shikimate dehydrogenase
MNARRVLIGLIGANIQGSLSPALQEDACAAAGLKGYYHLIDLDKLPGRRLPDLVSAVRSAGFRGVNVTFPCKEAVIPLLDEVSAEARQIGAVNTVTIDPAGRMVGYNTDRIGFRSSFEETLGADAVAGRAAVQIGAGGAGRAVAFALMDMQVATLLIYDRDVSRSSQLVAELAVYFGAERCRLIEDPASAMGDAAGVVNATPTGMSGFPGCPIAPEALRAEHWVADVIYTPVETELIKAGRRIGSRVMTGAGMCVHQGAASFRLFTGAEVSVARMHEVFGQALALRDGAGASSAE